jgi:hypothetical protein
MKGAPIAEKGLLSMLTAHYMLMSPALSLVRTWRLSFITCLGRRWLMNGDPLTALKYLFYLFDQKQLMMQ